MLSSVTPHHCLPRLSFVKWAQILLVVLSLSACSRDYPLVANGFSKTAELSALDQHGYGNFATPIPPGSCLLAFKAMPDLRQTQIRVVIEGEVDRTFNSAELMAALQGQQFKKGIFVVDPAGIRFEKGYDCDSKIR